MERKTESARSGDNRDRARLMQRLQALDFAIWETVLYLDAYPDNRRALDYYHRLIKERRTVLENVERRYGPMTAFGGTDRQSWDWIRAPWPWDPEANQ